MTESTDSIPIGQRPWFLFLKDQGLSIFSLLLVLLLAAGAFAISYDGLRDLAAQNGANLDLVWIWPLMLDGAIVVFSVQAFRAGICGETVLYPMVLVVVSTLASIAFNVLHAPVPTGEHWLAQSVLVPRIIASIPPLFLFLSFECMVRQLRNQVAKSADLHRIGELRRKKQHLEAEVADLETQAVVSELNRGAGEELAEEMVPGEFGAFVSSNGGRGMQPKPMNRSAKPKNGKTVAVKKPDEVPELTPSEAQALAEKMRKDGATLEEIAEATGRAVRTVTKYLREAGLTKPLKGSGGHRPRGWESRAQARQPPRKRAAAAA